jgi:hypothetical protein
MSPHLHDLIMVQVVPRCFASWSFSVNLVLQLRRPLQQPAAVRRQALRRDAGRAHGRPRGPHSRLPGRAEGVAFDSSGARTHRTALLRTLSKHPSLPFDVAGLTSHACLTCRVRSPLQCDTELSASSSGRRRPKRSLCWTTRACSGKAYQTSYGNRQSPPFAAASACSPVWHWSCRALAAHLVCSHNPQAADADAGDGVRAPLCEEPAGGHVLRDEAVQGRGPHRRRALLLSRHGCTSSPLLGRAGEAWDMYYAGRRSPTLLASDCCGSNPLWLHSTQEHEHLSSSMPSEATNRYVCRAEGVHDVVHGGRAEQVPGGVRRARVRRRQPPRRAALRPRHLPDLRGCACAARVCFEGTRHDHTAHMHDIEWSWKESGVMSNHSC